MQVHGRFEVTAARGLLSTLVHLALSSFVESDAAGVGRLVGTENTPSNLSKPADRMSRTLDRLTALHLRNAKPGMHPDGGGLYLQVKKGGRSWILRYSFGGRERYFGLGPLPLVTLAKARAAALRARETIREGVDPIEERRARRQAARLETAKAVTFREAAEKFIAANKSGWSNAKHAEQWSATLETYAYPILGRLPVQSIDTGLVVKVLSPIWESKTETATRVRQRIETVLNYASAKGHRTGENPARWRGHLDLILPRPRKVTKVKHHPAMPFTSLPEFFADLTSRKPVSARALAFTILTAARSGETRFAQRCEIDLANAVWTVPAVRIKARRNHRVPLSREAIAILRSAGLPDDPEALLFPNSNDDALSDATMLKYLTEDLGQADFTVHGFRSTFRDWVAERTNFPGEVAEAALAHIVGDQTEAAYRRGDLFDKRRKLMDMWARFCASGAPAAGKVVAIGRRGKTLVERYRSV